MPDPSMSSRAASSGGPAWTSSTPAVLDLTSTGPLDDAAVGSELAAGHVARPESLDHRAEREAGPEPVELGALALRGMGPERDGPRRRTRLVRQPLVLSGRGRGRGWQPARRGEGGEGEQEGTAGHSGTQGGRDSLTVSRSAAGSRRAHWWWPWLPPRRSRGWQWSARATCRSAGRDESPAVPRLTLEYLSLMPAEVVHGGTPVRPLRRANQRL
jgi:hypothetical protein